MRTMLTYVCPDMQPDQRTRRTEHAQAVMRRIGTQLIAEKKADIRREYADGKEKDAGLERKDLRGRDLLTLLLKANMATDVPDNQKLSDEDVLARTCCSVLRYRTCVGADVAMGL